MRHNPYNEDNARRERQRLLVRLQEAELIFYKQRRQINDLRLLAAGLGMIALGLGVLLFFSQLN